MRRATIVALLLACAAPLSAQQDAADSAAVSTAATAAGPTWAAPSMDRSAAASSGAEAVPPQASPQLPEEHWAVRAAARAEALGLAPSYFPAQRAVPRDAVARALAQAVQRASGTPFQRQTETWRARFVEEFPEYGDAAPVSSLRRLGAFAGVGGRAFSSRLAPAGGADPPAVIGSDEWAGVEALAAFALGTHLAASARSELGSGQGQVPEWDLIGRAGRFALSAGRGRVEYGWGRGGGFVFGLREPLTRVEVQTVRPVRVPVAGDAAFHLFFSRVDEDRHPGDPWLWGARVAARPHERLTLGITRGAMFGGAVSEVTPRRLLGSLVGVLRQEFDNQILSFDLRWRLPTEMTFPATAYVEWSADDGAGALDEQPAVLAGVYFPALPFAPDVAAGVEYARIADCCIHGSWYWHNAFTGNWARDDRPMGHPLAGGGKEARLYADVDAHGARLRVGGDAFLRGRATRSSNENTPGNLLVPGRAGSSLGGSLRATWRTVSHTELQLGAAGEHGGGWSEWSVQAALRYLF